MHPARHWFLLSLSTLLLQVGCARPDEDRCAELSSRLQHTLEERLQAHGYTGATAELQLPDCLWRGATGVSETSTATPMRPDDHFRVGSITKTFTSTVVLMLHAQGLVSLDDPLSQYVPHIPQGENISVRQLLNHTSGLYNYTENPRFLEMHQKNPARVWTPQELIELAIEQPPYFEPGKGWQYSNTNYILAGLIIEAVTNTPFHEQIRARILDPLGLEDTYMDGYEPPRPGLVHGYGKDPTTGSVVDLTYSLHLTAAGASGALVSSAKDLTTFYTALLSGNLLAPEQLKEMTTWIETGSEASTRYGLGMLEFPTPLGAGVGHAGGIPGFNAVAYHVREYQAGITVLVNTEGADSPAIASALLEQLARAQPPRSRAAPSGIVSSTR